MKYPTLEDNLVKIKIISEFEENWDGISADPIPDFMIDMMNEILPKLKIQPEIFPIPYGTIQFEYERDDKYLEFEILIKKENTLSVFEFNRDSDIENIYEIKATLMK